ncbi:MAG: BlaI/MecI/CopY family transcriptional regulator [Gemmatimonadaceae bacterium]|nr:BlaI/MecI/CopY family transcriptional regulator [Gemmatimonadaceae bacterium]NUQ94300.1 BlaI/MecI/CopY family transcriptional regulator [Gemmatimonadaceae bacterium]NUR20915.1 BlaI/MecI/CopY family transcriptional regulator [Gemmatimonadaceae bacterium]NUS97434.1 BlaI/MecI/CopY family transcriptional regulator [Gemmatimonadaceae bacterium]
MNGLPDLSRRERQIMSVIHRLGRATAAEVLGELQDPPSYSAVRAMLRILEEKGQLRHEQDGPRYVYFTTVPVDRAGRSALRDVVATFFAGSAEEAVATLIDMNERKLTGEELDRLAQLIDRAREEGR